MSETYKGMPVHFLKEEGVFLYREEGETLSPDERGYRTTVWYTLCKGEENLARFNTAKVFFPEWERKQELRLEEARRRWNLSDAQHWVAHKWASWIQAGAPGEFKYLAGDGGDGVVVGTKVRLTWPQHTPDGPVSLAEMQELAAKYRRNLTVSEQTDESGPFQARFVPFPKRCVESFPLVLGDARERMEEEKEATA